MAEVLLEKTLVIKSPARYLGEVLDDLPDFVYLNKTTTGSGGTTLALTNSRNYVVLVPYKSALRNKKAQHPNIIDVQAGVTEDDVYNLVQACTEPIKIMSTYDSYPKVYNALKRLERLQDFKLCCDEAHVLVSLAKIKGQVFNYLYSTFRDFGSYVFLTATPNDRTLLPTPIKDIEFVRVVWEAAEKVSITEQRVKTQAECNQFVVEICKQHLMGEIEGNAYIFYNSVNEIVHVIKKLKRMSGFKPELVNIFCADNPYNDRKINLQLGRGYLDGNFSDCKKINFLTSANYESCDIYDEVGKTYIVVSSRRNSTALTNHILVPQICGRLRNSRFKREVKMLVCGFEADIYQKRLHNFIETLDEMETTAKYLIVRALQTKEDGFEAAYQKDLESFATNPFIVVTSDGLPEFNEGAKLSELQTYQAFNSHIVTLDAVTSDQHTVRTVDNAMFTVSDEAKLLVLDRVDYARVMRQYIKALETKNEKMIKFFEGRSEVHKQHVQILGVDRIKKIGFNKTKITQAFDLAMKFNDLNLEISRRLGSIRLGSRYTSKHLVALLQGIYDNLGIDKKAVSADINKFFVTQKVQVKDQVDGKRKQGFQIIANLFK